MKNVFDFRKELIGEYARFSTSFAKPSAEDVVALLKKEYGSGRYWREPLIQINPNYEKDRTVDELHTYRGRQGSDVAMLVRRLRAQLNADNLLCIGTSATMAGVGQAGDKRKAIADHREGCGRTHWLWRGHYRLCLECKDVNSANGRDANRLAGISGEGVF